MATPPQSTKASLARRLNAPARTQWHQLSDLRIRHRGAFACIDGELPDGDIVRLMRPRYTSAFQHVEYVDVCG